MTEVGVCVIKSGMILILVRIWFGYTVTMMFTVTHRVLTVHGSYTFRMLGFSTGACFLVLGDFPLESQGAGSPS